MEFQFSMSDISKIFILFFSILFITGCEEEYTPVNSGDGPKYVVEGYLEAGENPFPPYLILTKSFDFYSELGPDQFTESFVHAADVRVSDGTIEVQFEEVCLLDLPIDIREAVAAQFGFNPDSLEVNFCVYVDLLNQLQPQVNKTYNLQILVDGDSITASTFIPPHVPLQDFHFLPPSGQPNDSLAQLRVTLSDPPGERNFYRYFVGTNGSALETDFSSVEEDLYFDGKTFEFVIFNPRTTNGDVEPDEFGLYFVGDTIQVKWTSIDEAHYDFWNTLEFSNANQGPFSSYTRLQSNIKGGLGIWGGYSVSYYTGIVTY